MKNIIKNIGLTICIGMIVMACSDDIDPLITELELDRPLAPVGLTAHVRNQTTLELNWNTNEGDDHYLVEFSDDSLRFNSIIRTTTVLPEELPIQETFDGNTRYSVRVKAVGTDQKESKWAAITTRTNPEQIFTSTIPLEIQGTSATIAWVPGSEVTNFLIVPGNIILPISDAQKAAGEATITGLTGGTSYTVTIYNGRIKRGTIEFRTLKQADLSPLDDLGEAIDAAAEGDTLILAAGTYVLDSKEITKSITLEGQNILDKPIIKGDLTCNSTVLSISLRYLHFQGDGRTRIFTASSTTSNVAQLVIEGSLISDYSRGIIGSSSSSSGGTFGDISILDTRIYDIIGDGGDALDFRTGAVGSLTIDNSTIYNGLRSFLRMELASDVSITNVTFYRACTFPNSNNRGFFRMSGGSGSLQVANCLFVETGVDFNGTLLGVWSTAGDISEGVSTNFSNNYYFDVIGLFDGVDAAFTDPSQVDASEADPQFEEPENGDFSVNNQLLIDEQIGDPRWWQ